MKSHPEQRGTARTYKKGIGISWVRGLEHQRRGTIHYHALLSGVGRLRRYTYERLWWELAGFARIERPRSCERVLHYVTKYVVKGGEIDFGGPYFKDPSLLPLPLPFDP
jgi:hypothetical protein